MANGSNVWHFALYVKHRRVRVYVMPGEHYKKPCNVYYNADILYSIHARPCVRSLSNYELFYVNQIKHSCKIILNSVFRFQQFVFISKAKP